MKKLSFLALLVLPFWFPSYVFADSTFTASNPTYNPHFFDTGSNTYEQRFSFDVTDLNVEWWKVAYITLHGTPDDPKYHGTDDEGYAGDVNYDNCNSDDTNQYQPFEPISSC
jgi:hypothetical protein